MRQQSSGEGHWYRDPEERKGLHYYCLSFCGPVDEGMLDVGLGQTSTKVEKGEREYVLWVWGPTAVTGCPNLSPVPPQQHANLVMTQDPYKVTTFGKPYAVAMQYLWRDAGIRACYERRREFHLLDSAM